MLKPRRRPQKSSYAFSKPIAVLLLLLTLTPGLAGFPTHLDWLERNVGSEGDYARLKAAAEKAPNLRLAEDVLEKFGDRLQSQPDRARAVRLRAEILELRGKVEEAENLYRRAFEHDPKAIGNLLAAGGLALERGDLETARSDAQSAFEKAEAAGDRGKRESGVLLLARATTASGELKAAYTELQQYSENHDLIKPETLMYKADLAARLGKDERREALLKRIAEQFPESPELRLARRTGGRGDPWVQLRPSPAGLFGSSSGILSDAAPSEQAGPDQREPDRRGARDTAEEAKDLTAAETLEELLRGGASRTRETEKTGEQGREGSDASRVAGVQTGSFSIEENAEYMVRDLREAGFSGAEVRERTVGGTKYYQVVVPVDRARSTRSDAQQLVVELKEQGFEGFLLFEYNAD